MSTTFKPGDKVRCVNAKLTGGALIKGAYYTVSDVGGPYIDLEDLETKNWSADRFELVQAATSSYSSDVASFVADVEAGRIKRGGVPGKYRVFRNDADNVVVEFFN